VWLIAFGMSTMVTAASKAGFITKQGHKIKTWLPRYMVLDRALCSLVYYKGTPPLSLREKGRVSLVGATVVDSEGCCTRPNCFDVVTAAGVHYPIQARDAQDKNEWVAAVRAAIVAGSRDRDRIAQLEAATVAAPPGAAIDPSILGGSSKREVAADDALITLSESSRSLAASAAAAPAASSSSVPATEGGYSSDDSDYDHGDPPSSLSSSSAASSQSPPSQLSSSFGSNASSSSGVPAVWASPPLLTMVSASGVGAPVSSVVDPAMFERSVSFQQVIRQATHNEYVIALRCHGETWSIQRRYSNFATLHAELKREFPPPYLARHILPAKRMIGANTPEFLAERKMLLEHYLRELFNDPVVCQSASFRRFVEYDEHMAPVMFRRVTPAVSNVPQLRPQVPITVAAAASSQQSAIAQAFPYPPRQ
jgi:hypothetical protein